MKNFFFAAAAAACIALHLYRPPSLRGDSIIVYGDRGYFNRGYRSYEYKDRPRLTFPVPMTSIGAEISLSGPGGYTWGGGMSSVQISGGSKKNWIYTERQEKTSIFVPYCFVGYDFTILAMELGISYYITSRSQEERDYYTPDGGTAGKGDGLFFERSSSYVFNNACVRILKKEYVHVKIRYGREQFNAIDSLFNFALVLPAGSGEFDIFMSNSAGKGKRFPESNQRAGLSYLHGIHQYLVGISMSCLLGNFAGGGGAGSLSFAGLERYNVGFQAGVRWQ